jgi:WD40 repeat protein
MQTDVKELVRPDRIKAPLDATTHDEAIDELCHLLVSDHGLDCVRDLSRNVLSNEGISPFPFVCAGGLAVLSHGYSALLRELCVVVGKCRTPMPLRAPTDERVHYVFLVVGPEGWGKEVREILGSIFVLFDNTRTRNLLKDCTNSEEIHHFLIHVGLDLRVPSGFQFVDIIEPSLHNVRALSWASDGRLACSMGGGDDSISIYSRNSKVPAKLVGHRGEVTCLAWSPAGDQLASASVDRTIRIWSGRDLVAGRVIPSEVDVHGICWSQDGKTLAAACHLRHVRRWDVATGNDFRGRLDGLLEPALCVAWSHNGTKLAAAGGRMPQGFLVWDAAKGSIIKKCEIEDVSPFSIAWSGDDALLAIGTGNGSVQIWKADKWESPKNFRAHNEAITCLGFAYLDNLLATKSAEGSVRVWKGPNWDMVADLPDPGAGANLFAPLAFHPQELKLATLGGHGNAIRIWSISPRDLVTAPKSTPFATLRIPNQLIDAIRERNAVLFAGSGMSVNVLEVGSSDLKSKIGAEIRKDYPDYNINSRSFEELMDEYSELYDLPTLLDKIAGLIPQNVPVSSAHRTAVNLFKCIITSNWDLLFEDACTAAGIQRQVIATESSIEGFPRDYQDSRWCRILKIHGSIDEPTSIVATSYQYDTYHVSHPRTIAVIAELFASNTVLFAGYRLGDAHIRRVLETVRTMKGHLAKKAYIVGLFDEVRFETLKRRHGFEVIQCDTISFFSELSSRLSW